MKIDEIKRKHIASGGHFFDTDWMIYFGTRVYSTVFVKDSIYRFITSEQDHHGAVIGNEKVYVNDGKMGYTIREFNREHHIHTIGSTQEYDTYEKARQAILDDGFVEINEEIKEEDYDYQE